MTIDLACVDLAGVGTDALEAGLCGFQARLTAATACFVLAVAEYDRRRGWESWECRSMAHWLSWRCGISPAAGREHVRVGHALEDLPAIRERFRAGRLSYSQVRAVTRVATPDTDELLANLAGAMTAAQLEEVVRAFRRSNEVDEVAADARHTRRRLSYHWDDDGTLRGSFVLPAETGAVLVKAVEGSAGPAEAQAAAEGGADGWAAARADALVAMAEDHLASSTDAEAESADRYLVNILVDQPTLLAGGSDGDRVCEVEGGPGLAPATVRRLACDNPSVTVTRSGDGSVLDVGRRTRRIGRRLRRALACRDGGCRFPGCTTKRTQAHHIVHWADGGPTSMDNLVSLCSRHHHRHHEGGFRIERPRPGRLIFVRADGREIPDRPAPPEVTAPGGGLASNTEPFSSEWEGGHLPLDDIVYVLHQAAGTLDPATPVPGTQAAGVSAETPAAPADCSSGPAPETRPLPGSRPPATLCRPARTRTARASAETPDLLAGARSA
jgi:hypothetical protein